MPYAAIRDCDRCHYIDVGSGPPVILLHGSASAGAAWKTVMERLLPDHRVLAPDFPGYGQSGSWKRGRTLPTEGDLPTVEAMLDIAGEPAHLVGHSYGGTVAINAAKRHPEQLASLALIEPVSFQLLSFKDEPETWQEIVMLARRHIDLVGVERDADAAAAFVGFWTSAGFWTRLIEPMRALVIGSMPRVAAEWQLMFDSVNDLDEIARIRTPTQLLIGSETPLAARQVMAHLTAALPHADLVTLVGAGHMSPATHAKTLAGHLRNHIAASGGQTGEAA